MLISNRAGTYNHSTQKTLAVVSALLLMLGLLGCSNRLKDTRRDMEYHPAVSAFFESKDPFVRKVIIPNIDANRKSDVTLEFVSQDGTPLSGCGVSAELKRHEFLLGHCDLATEKDPKTRALLNEVFYYTCPGNAMKWKSLAPSQGVYDFSRADAVLDFCKERDAAVEWHFLSGYHPSWLESVGSDQEKGQLQFENGRNVLNRYHDKVRFVQVFNEDWLTHISAAKVYSDQTSYFSQLRKEFPDVKLGVCDCWSYNAERRLPDVDELTERYPGIDFISMHAHNPRQLWASPEEMYQTYSPYLDSNIKVHVTEFGIIKGQITGTYRSGEWDDEKLAEYFVQTLVTAFSHKSVEAFNFWSNYEKFTGNILFTDDGKPNTKYEAIRSLIQDKLTTRVAGKTDKRGKCSFRGFDGNYNITLDLDSGIKTQVPLEIDGNSSRLKLIVNEATCELTVAP